MLEATEQLDQLGASLQSEYVKLEQASDARDISESIAKINQHVSLLDRLARQLSQQMTPQNQEEIVPVLQKIATLTEQTLTDSQQQLEKAKAGILTLRQTAAGVSAYHQVKKIR
ncbi:hypothetical protein K0504_07175 [Neiella marina]|uniref:Uncharacterized protein n=1 Tax=Neiella holothuriorum TaxID=2870530 RepID=A0ABS7EEP4_9GAMM|nr:hypothetical protein [Neiella holothuriorum]MBW8190812.1 hypothetical protein [Neiella holothuriorum]